MVTFNSNHTAADIVKQFPKASDLFKKNRIDFCCGGDKPLGEVFETKSLSGEEILHELNESYGQWLENGNVEINWDAISDAELIDYILEKHHHYLNEELPALGQFVTKIYRVHGQQHPHLKELHEVYHQLKTDLESHLIEEEKFLFPLIKNYQEKPDLELLESIKKLNQDMEQEHIAAGDFLQKIHQLTNGFEPPEGACNSYRITYARLAELESNTFQHIHLENNILFKKFVS
ncbi:iron-sulfur cluster repair di-iron protein [Aquibacillus rhizosphaerae]|uniref:Iron-sulfur cluster repair di-iron protein n=1 Tax=Aquibacillus rhizosphaerae TaxID=3051431 RepID=A0ABT7L8H2_9BACI|nr:iron-sulfur cluster repair di-iron protein [Aquibacillus sp. LR5S19]MDL4842163.1 iron-sulfur cluster repair di-iron protein [Aquibacillus sp. LR5S19]